MLTRQPIAANRFYPGDPNTLKNELGHYLQNDAKNTEHAGQLWGAMLPHAGYIFCGSVIGKTLGGQKLPSRLIILCPNHTGRGKMFSVWAEGQWLTPLGAVPVDESLSSEITASTPLFEADTLAHLGEHSIEVILPFLQMQIADLRIVPICVGVQNPKILAQAGAALAQVLKLPQNKNVGLIVSSDMNHYEDQKTTILKDEHALQAALAADPDQLLRTVSAEQISMCGAAPLALALYTARHLAKVEVEFVAHDTSAKAARDAQHVVGYAGLRMYL